MLSVLQCAYLLFVMSVVNPVFGVSCHRISVFLLPKCYRPNGTSIFPIGFTRYFSNQFAPLLFYKLRVGELARRCIKSNFLGIMKHTNALIGSSSPYLLQHAHNPVNWEPWSEEALVRAEKEHKLVLVSIGYAACHWCHVMEHESFEDEEVAALMNAHFVCIKVDREERPDVDQYYMNAVQLMNNQGGWPLNVIALPDGRPVWGGTYFPKSSWMERLTGVFNFYTAEPEKTKEYAARLLDGIENLSLNLEFEDSEAIDESMPEKAVQSWKAYFDWDEGGRRGAPKFPMPVNLEFLLYFGFIKNDAETLQFVQTTLEKMARGGIYDQIGGGFARYSVDGNWKIPHFEKMLYDNGQLLSVYSKGYQLFNKDEFKSVVYETANFIERELMDASGAFYSSLDADSEGEEGKYYVWEKKQLRNILDDDYPLFSAYFNVDEKGYWENNKYILLRSQSEEDFARDQQLSPRQMNVQLGSWKYRLLKEREKRVRPGLDDKTLASWNALTIIGLINAFNAFHDDYFLQLALKNARFITGSMLKEKNKLYHSWKNGVCSVDGFLEDYALVISSFLSLYETTGDESWLKHSKKLMKYVFTHFFSEEKGLFYFTSMATKSSISNAFQNEDNVLPSANSVMANNLHRMYLLLGKPEYLAVIHKMLGYVTAPFKKYPMAYANWGVLMLKLTEPHYEIAVCGFNSNLLMRQLKQGYQPHIVWAFTSSESNVPLLKNRFKSCQDLIYVCKKGECHLPQTSVEKAKALLKL